jgi:hypothetical protein
MNEVQGVAAAGTSRLYRNLTEALRAHRVPEENHEFIAAIVDAVGVTGLIDRGRYIEALRRGEGANLHIGKTYTNGFTEDERILVGGASLRLEPSEGRAPFFYVTHPSALPSAAPSRPKRRTGARAATPRSSAPKATRAPAAVERDYGVCDTCFMVRNAAGNCMCD